MNLTNEQVLMRSLEVMASQSNGTRKETFDALHAFLTKHGPEGASAMVLGAATLVGLTGTNGALMFALTIKSVRPVITQAENDLNFIGKEIEA